jgi:hypothetical protein
MARQHGHGTRTGSHIAKKAARGDEEKTLFDNGLLRGLFSVA